jgi:UDP-N-acetylmuramoyl-L-alanyl-D-glutamate--2,6-diaminopimelate ligase
MTVGTLLDRAVASATTPVGGDAVALSRTVTGVAYDSRAVEAGDVFVAIRGRHRDGGDYTAQAIERGAVAIVTEAPPISATAVPWVVVDDARVALGRLSAELWDDPSRALRVVGITGTNGKTTTAHLVAAIFEAAGLRCGLVGTVEYRLGGVTVPATRTTPEASDVQGMLARMREAGCRACAMEVSSHALALRRTDAVHFAAGVFTNLTRDHLDFHGSMDDYFAAKRRLFELMPPNAPAVVNVDDPRGTVLAESVGRPVTYAVSKPAHVSPGPLDLSFGGLSFDVRCPQGVVRVRSRLVGKPNVYNILAAVGVAAALEVPLDAIEAGLAGIAGVPGRFEVVSSPSDDVMVVVDYAHTDDALKNLLETARQMARRVVTVFGAGGERDRTKRPLMGLVAARLSDAVVITSDNPRGEDPGRIMEEVMRGAEPEIRRRPVPVATIVDRAEAIHYAVVDARPGDLVLLAGKGHEKVQEVAGVRHPFDDAAVARDALAVRRVRRERTG